MPNVEFESARFHLDPGDRLLLVTDGVTEPLNRAGHPVMASLYWGWCSIDQITLEVPV